MSAEPDRATRFLEGRGRARRSITGPEGVPLTVELADRGERILAVTLDMTFQIAAMLGIAFLVLLTPAGRASALVWTSLLLFAAFVLRSFYFIYFELARRGQTPGKRIAGLRVVDRQGGPLRAAAVVARNLTREVEIFLPLGILLSPVSRGTAAWQQLALLAWLLLFLALPLFNRDRLRVGDLIAGTLVIAVPRRILLGDLAAAAPRHAFTEPQLRLYGTFELQVLEALLRRPRGKETTRLRREVAGRIARKIAWPAPLADDEVDAFLAEFYTAERAFLEREQLFGRARADKHAAGSPPGAA